MSEVAGWARKLLTPWTAKAELRRVEDRVAELQATVARLEQALERQSAEMRRGRAPQPFGCPMPDGTMLVQTVYGNRYYIDPLDAVTGPELIVNRLWEADISGLLLSAAHRDLAFVDVGANFGYFTCLIGARIGRAGAGRVYAIEPNPACAALLRRNVEINWSMCPVEIVEGAVGDRPGTVKLYVPANHSANAYLGDAHNLDWTNFPSVEVALRPLDAILPEDLAVELMKIDVEGHEQAVLSGARATIARSPRLRVVMEWSPDQMVRAGYCVAGMVELLRDLGLRASRIAKDFSPESLEAGALDEASLGALGYGNVILWPR
jgi:FkbM family methyltransferase